MRSLVRQIIFILKISTQKKLNVIARQLFFQSLKNSSTNHFLSPNPVSDWLMFCGRNLILHLKRYESGKNAFFYQAKKSRKGTFKHEIEFFILNSPYRPVMNHPHCGIYPPVLIGTTNKRIKYYVS